MSRFIFLVILVLIQGRICNANMSSPIIDGSYQQEAYSSQNIDIEREVINIRLREKGGLADFNIKYYIKSDSSGIQIPQLFVAKNLHDGFKVSIDGIELPLKEIPDNLRYIDFNYKDSLLSARFPEFSRDVNIDISAFKVEWNSSYYRGVYISELAYFEVDISKGKHLVEVDYVAEATIDLSGWAKEYTLEYSLYPAAYWKSFGSLEINLDASKRNANVDMSLGAPELGNPDSVAVWKFNKLPAGGFTVTINPKVNALAEFLIGYDRLPPTMLLTLIFSIFIIIIHTYFIRRERLNKNDIKLALWLKIGAFVNSFLITNFWIFSYSIIDGIIGDEASKYHGYIIFEILLYPFFLVVYMLIIISVDFIIKWSMKRRKLE